jgi:hypothetical protein
MRERNAKIPIDTHDLKPILTEVRVLKIVSEVPKTITSLARNRLRARLLSVGLCKRGTQNIPIDTHDLKHILT